ncbi:MAG: hypothetical protein HN350_04365 [Phycisphaerales bacterium]|jgi:hypothetical protein|nr:hypothetical protein [Phycisphaerales bacterium]
MSAGVLLGCGGALGQDAAYMPKGAKIVSCTAAEVSRGKHPASYAIDGNPKTMWHTSFRPKAKPHPHEIVIDLGQSIKVTGISYLPRQDQGVNGVIQDIECTLSEKANAWGAPAARGRLYGKVFEQYPQRTIAFEKPAVGRYLRIRSLATVTAAPFTSAAEIGIYTGKVRAAPLIALPKKKSICFALYTTQNKVLKLTAQLYPGMLPVDGEVVLEIQEGKIWNTVGKTKPVLPGWSAMFRVEGWDMTKTSPYRVRVGKETYKGIIRRDPVDKRQVVAGVFTGNSSYPWGGGRLPKQDIVDNINKIDPDVLLFTGDQIYVHSNHTTHWIRFGEIFGDMIRNRPTVCIPDDHDVGQPNIWGNGGRKVDRDTKGGYTKPAEYVNMVQRQQCWHLPDPYDPKPIAQGLTVYYTRMVVGGIDFAIIEDRKFKSGPFQFGTHKNGLAKRPDFIEKPNYNPKDYDLPGLKLLGDRQLKFLADWSRNWRGAVMKTVVSQTVFAQTSTHHGPKKSFYYVDFDANGWPQTGRRKALELMQRCAAFHVCGDQHLSSIGQYGIADWRDAGWWFCVPSISNTYPRWWQPKTPPVKALNNGIPHTGDFYDSLKNKMTIYTHTNPVPVTREPIALNERMPGFGVVRFDKPTRKITMECWPRMMPVDDPKSKQYKGWPRTITQFENDGRKAVAWLPKLDIKGVKEPVIEVINEKTGMLVYSVRMQKAAFRSPVFAKGTYTIRIGDPDSDRWQTRKGIVADDKENRDTLKITIH